MAELTEAQAGKRLTEIYSYYLDERYQDDLSATFSEWLVTSEYGDELTEIAALRLDVAFTEELRAAAPTDGAVTGDGVGQTSGLTSFEDRARALYRRHKEQVANANEPADPRDAELTRLRERADAAERERDELARKLAAANEALEDMAEANYRLAHSHVSDQRDELQAAVNAAVAGVENLSPLEALTRLLELRRRAGGKGE